MEENTRSHLSAKNIEMAWTADDDISETTGLTLTSAEQKKQQLAKNRCFHYNHCYTSPRCLYVTIGIIILMVSINFSHLLFRAERPKVELSSSSSLPNDNPDQTLVLHPFNMGEKRMLERLEHTFGTDAVTIGTVMGRASLWLLRHDTMHMLADNIFLDQRYVLAVIYYQMGGDVPAGEGGWGKSWLDGEECEWDGVSCSDEKFVEGLDLAGRGLAGIIPNLLWGLKYLKFLDLRNNKISGVVPTALPDRLISLRLDGNKLQAIPEQICARRQWESLQVLTIGCKNQLIGIKMCPCCTDCEDQRSPSSKPIKSFDNLIGEPVSSTNKPTILQVEKLSAADHQKLNSLRARSIENKCSQISGSRVSNKGSPQNLAMKWLVIHDEVRLDPGKADDRFFIQRYVIALIHFSALDDLWSTSSWLSHRTTVCKYEEIQCNTAGEVTQLNLAKKSIAGKVLNRLLPKEIKLLTKLSRIDLSDNQIQGSVPIELESLINLESLILKGNELTGTVPSKVCSICTLRTLEVDCDKITCSCCSACSSGNERESKIKDLLIDECPKKQGTYHAKALDWILHGDKLQLSSNHPKLKQRYILALLYFGLNGDDTVHISSKNNVNELGPQWLSAKSICAWMGVSCEKNGHVSVLSLESENLKGRIPSELGQLEFLTKINFRNNAISGNIPLSFGGLKMMSSIVLDSNKMSGDIPILLCSLRKVHLDELCVDQYNGVLKCPYECCTRCFT